MSGLSPARLDGVVDVVNASLGVMFPALVEALEEGGHVPRGPKGRCPVCDEPWLCGAADKVLNSFRAVNEAMRAVGCEEEVFACGGRHQPRGASALSDGS